MIRPVLTRSLIGALLLGSMTPADAFGQQAVVARQSPGGFDLVGIDETSLLTNLLLLDVTFLPASVAGLPPRDVFRLDRPVPVGADGPAPRIRLPDHGSLYLVQRSGQTALVRVAIDGGLSVALERADLAPEIGASSDGSRVLLVEPGPGGDALWAVDVGGGGAPQLLTSGLAGLAIDRASLRAGPHDAWFLADGTLFHADLSGTGLALSVDLGLAVGEFLMPEIVISDVGTRAALVTEQLDGTRNLRVVDASGAHQLVSSGTIHGPCLASNVGPLVALSPSGTSIAWSAAVTVGAKTANELFVTRIDLPSPPTQVTSDLHFTDTIDNVGILGFKAEGLLTFLAGEQALLDPTLAVGSADVFGVDPAAPNAITNLSQTSGDVVAPFLVKGELEVQQLYLDPLGERFVLLVDPNGGDFALLLQDAGSATAPTELVGAMDLPPQVHAAGASLFIVAQPNVIPAAQQLILLPPASDPAGPRVMAQTSAAVSLDRFTSSRDPGQAAFVASAGAPFELPILVDLDAKLLLPVWDKLLAVSPAMAFTPSGRLSVGIGIPGGPFLYAGFTGPLAGVKFPVPIGFGFPLDG